MEDFVQPENHLKHDFVASLFIGFKERRKDFFRDCIPGEEK